MTRLSDCPRERQVLALIIKGDTNHAITNALVIAERTAEIHISTIRDKLDVTFRTQAEILGVPMWPAERVEYRGFCRSPKKVQWG